MNLDINKKTVIFDADDVVVDLKHEMCEALNCHTGKNLKCDDWFTFNITSIYDNLDINDFYKIIIDNKLLENAKPINGAVEAINAVKDKGYQIVFISSRAYHPNAEELTKSWLTRYGIPYDNVHISGNGIKKSSYANLYNKVRMAIDDNIENCEDYKLNCKIQINLLMTQPWNIKNNVFKRVNKLVDAIEYL